MKKPMKIYGTAYVQIKRKRENVMKLFVTDCYLSQEPNWNNNPDIYAFNDCLYSLKEKKILENEEINKEWYINHTCNYKYEDLSICKEKIKAAKQALGKAETVKFNAGKVLIQTNKMPSFTVIDPALKRRIIVINFPYCFTDDKKKVNENPTKYKASNSNLKVMFKQPEYKIAMIELLFENYEDKYIEIPHSVKKYTNSYFEEESIVSWVQENYRLATEEEIDDHKLENPRTLPSIMINTIKYEYERETGKKLSIKTIATQLIDEGFDIKGGNSSKALNGYVCNDPETIYE